MILDLISILSFIISLECGQHFEIDLFDGMLYPYFITDLKVCESLCLFVICSHLSR